MRISVVFILLLSFFSLHSTAQQNFLPLQRDLYNQAEFKLVSSDSDCFFHTSVKPFLNSKLKPFANPDSLFEIRLWGSNPENGFFGKLWYNLKNDHLITVDKDILHMTIDPAVDFAGGLDVSDDFTLFNNTRGFVVTGDLGSKFSFSTSYFENQAGFPEYISEFIRDSSIVPGQGRVKKFKSHSFDFPNASGYISFSPSKYFNFQFGHDKNFIGDGYRSLLLSDNSFRYPFFKITTQVWRLQYVNLYTEYLDVRDKVTYEEGFQKKYGSFHYLSILFGDFMEAGLFEGVIWEGSDSTHSRGYDFNYLNPIIFYHSVQFGLGSPDNSVIGLNVKINPIKEISLYGQLLLDDWDFGRSKTQSGFYRDKYAFQIGVKYFNAFTVKNLYVQTEYNQVWPYTYAQKSIVQNYAHYNQSLADPLGSNFRESVSFISYRYGRFFVETELMVAVMGVDSAITNSNVGHDIYRSDLDIPGSYDSQGNFVGTYGNFVTQGIKTNILYTQLRIDFLLNPKMNLNLELQAAHRTYENIFENTSTNWFSIGLRTNLFNKYYDF